MKGLKATFCLVGVAAAMLTACSSAPEQNLTVSGLNPAKFDKPTDLSANDYGCGGYFKAPADSDSISVDSLTVDGEKMVEVVDEMGNIVSQPAHQNANQQALPDNKPAAEEPKQE